MLVQSIGQIYTQTPARRPAAPAYNAAAPGPVGDSVTLGASPASPPTPSPTQPDYHFQSPNEVYQDAAGRWQMKLPNAVIPLPGRPQWLARIDQLNAVLDASPAPRELRAHVDAIRQIADRSYDSASLRFEPLALHEYVGGIEDRRMLSDIRTIYKMYLDDETMSTHREGGAMAGARCSQMHKYGAIMEALARRLG